MLYEGHVYIGKYGPNPNQAITEFVLKIWSYYKHATPEIRFQYMTANVSSNLNIIIIIIIIIKHDCWLCYNEFEAYTVQKWVCNHMWHLISTAYFNGLIQDSDVITEKERCSHDDNKAEEE